MEIQQNEDLSLDYSIVKEEYKFEYEEQEPKENSETVEFLITEVNERKYKCSICERAFTQSYHLNNHMAIHSTEKNFRCPHCSKTFANKQRLGCHIRSHTNEYLTCNECGGTYRGTENLRSHITRKHRTTIRQECEICKKTFADKLSVKRHVQAIHLRIKTEKKAYPCEECGRILSTKLSFERHMSIHSNVKSVECPICSKKFRIKYLLQQHMVVHSEKMSFVCEICHKAFKRRGSLRLHIKSQHKILKKEFKVLRKVEPVESDNSEEETRLSTENSNKIKIEKNIN